MLGTAVAAAMFLAAPLANAATQDGTVGSTSTGTMDVFINVPGVILIQGLDPVALDYTTGAGDLTATETFCVWTSGNTSYNLTISALSSSGTTVFAATDGATTIDYGVEFADEATGAGFAAVTEGSLIGAQTPQVGGVPCTADNASLRISATEAGNLDAALSGAYSDELTLLVAPI
jgi:hypothetical protein